jgi:hypothetical protein
MRSRNHATSVPPSLLDNAFSPAYLAHLREQDETLTAAEAGNSASNPQGSTALGGGGGCAQLGRSVDREVRKDRTFRAANSRFLSGSAGVPPASSGARDGAAGAAISYLTIEVAMLGLLGFTARVRVLGMMTRSMSSMGIAPRRT